jgi:hypothetical protein
MRNFVAGMSALGLGLSVLAMAFIGCGSDEVGAADPAAEAGSLAEAGPALDSGRPGDAGAAKTFTVSASIVGLTGSGLVLQDKSGAELPVTAQAGGATQKVTFATKLPAGAEFEVTVKAQPTSPPQLCVVTGGKGTVVAGDVETVTVNCSTQYTVSGTVSGLAGTGLILQNNAGDDITVNANGQFAFPTPLASGAAYAVTVKANPTNKWQTCIVSTADAGAGGGAGTIASANVTDVAVTCTTNKYSLSVEVAGVAGSGLVFQNNLADDLAAPTNAVYPFATMVESGAAYAVTVLTQPTSPWQTCAVTAPSSTMKGANVVLTATCTTNKYKVGGTLAGLQGSGLVLQNNLGNDLTLNVADNGPFAFGTTIASGLPYSVTIKTQPTGVAGELCNVTAAAGNVASADVTTVAVSCTLTKKVFVTSALYNGNLGGLAGADAKCQALADAAALGGNYKAWLSDSTGSPSTRFTQSTVPYVLVDGSQVADNWADLVDGSLDHAISLTETGGASTGDTIPPGANFFCGPTGTPWTATSASGAANGSSCSNWSSTSGGSSWGQASSTSGSWSSYCGGGSCAWLAPLFCFQQ